MEKKKTKKDLSFYMGNVAIIFVTLMFSFFPLYVSDRYYYIRHDKLYAFYVLASLLVIVMGSVLLTHYNKRDKENKILLH